MLTRFDQDVINGLMSASPVGVAAVGTESRLARGSLTYGRRNGQFIVANDFYGTVNAVAGDLPGYRFINAKMAILNIADQGTTATKWGVVVQANPLYNVSTRGFTLYTNDTAITSLLSLIN